MGETSAPDRRVVASAVTLAFQSSRLRDMVEVEALEAVFHIDAAELVREGAVDLQAAWAIAADLAGFEPEAARAPIAVLKTWEARFGAPVRLPDEVGELSDKDVALAKAECAPGQNDIRRAFEPPEERAARLAVVTEELPSSGTQSSEIDAGWRHNPVVAWVAGGALVIALSVSGVALFRALNTSPDWASVDQTDVAGDIPVSRARLFGKQLGLTLSDDGWLKRPAAERKQQLETALRRADIPDLATVFVEDSQGRVRATAQWYDMPPKVRVRLY